ncbi:MAG: acyl-CoA dehydrogenase family protein [Reyranellaceae bacterium]
MDCSFTKEQLEIQDTIRRAAERDLAPLVKEAERTETCPLEVFKWAAAQGILGINFPTEYGGAGLDKVTSMLVIEELGRVNSGFAGSVMSQSGVATEAILRFGSEEQRRKYLPSTFKGEAIAGIAMTEPDTGSDISNLRTTAQPDGNGFRLNGAKIFASNATIASYMTIVARLPGTSGRNGISLFIVDTNNPGFKRASPIKKLGHRTQDTGQFTLEDAWVDSDCVIGELGKGLSYVQSVLTSGRLDYASRSNGVSQSAFEKAIKYAKERRTFGNPIAKYQAIRFKLARMAMDIEASRSLLLRAAWMYDQGMEMEREASMAKLFSAEVAQRVTWESLQIHGAYGYTREFEIESLFRDARLFTISEGTSEMQQIMIARSLGLDS